MAIIREKAFRINAREISYKIGITQADVKRALISLCKLYYLGYPEAMCTDDEWNEEDLVSYFKKEMARSTFPQYPQKVIDFTAKWAVKEAVRSQYLVASKTAHNKYLFSDYIINRAL